MVTLIFSRKWDFWERKPMTFSSRKWDFSPAQKARLKPHFQVISQSQKGVTLARGDRYNFLLPTGEALVRGIEEGLVPLQGDRYNFLSPTGEALVRGIEEGLVPLQGDRYYV